MRTIMRSQRLRLGYTQGDVARLLEYKHPSTYAKIERGEADPSASKLIQLERILGLPAAVMLGQSCVNNTTNR